MKHITINENGLAQIKTALAEKHKLGGEHFTTSMLLAWASDVENSWSNGNGAAFEITDWDAVSGHPEVVVVTEAGYDLHDDGEDK